MWRRIDFATVAGSVTVYLAQTIRCDTEHGGRVVSGPNTGRVGRLFPDGRATFTAKALASLSLEGTRSQECHIP